VSTFQLRGAWNLVDFLRIVHRLGFMLIVNVGPYVDADWEYGGLPSWLLRDRHMTVRSSTYPPFLQYVARYFGHLLPLIERWTYRRRGPVIALQVDQRYMFQMSYKYETLSSNHVGITVSSWNICFVLGFRHYILQTIGKCCDRVFNFH